MDTNKKNINEMNLGEMIKIMLGHKKLYGITCACAFLFGIIISLSIPKTYKSKVMLSPETNNGTKSLGSLGTLSSMIGSNLNILGQDAINPQYYPNVMQSTKFVVSLFDIKLESKDGKIKTTLYDYCKKHQKRAWWSLLNPLNLIPASKSEAGQGEKPQLYGVYLTQEQDNIVNMIKNMLSCKFNPQDEFITITATTQDPLISTELVDSASYRLQSFIIEYRTSKARHDLNYMQKLYDESADRYNKARIRYANYCDSYGKLAMQSYITKRDELENQMQLEYSIYSQLAQQLQMAKGKVMERTPVFAVIEPATVPLHKNAPKTMLITIGWMLVATIGTTAWVFYKNKQ